jgi:pimeloyl-ACP methyl ester carboxylesterase
MIGSLSRLVLSIAALSTAGFLYAAQPEGMRMPLTLAAEGYFYVGGTTIAGPGGNRHVDQMYVAYQVPAKRSHPYPIIMVHGGGTTGVAFEGTPDDREGWREFFVRRGYSVYVVDSPTQGRSPYDETADGPRVHGPAGSAEKMFTATERYNLWPQARLHTQFPGTGADGDPIYEQTVEASSAFVTGEVRTDKLNRDALVALLDRIGPAIILTHSRSGPYGWLAADARPGLVKGIVAVEPNGPPFENPASQSGNAPPTATRRDWGITYERLGFEPAVETTSDLAPHQDAAEAPGLLGCWRMGAPTHRLPHLAGVPILIVTSEASYHAQYDHCTSRFLSDAGVANEHVRLEARGIRGNGHLMMWEKNNLEIAALINGWLERHEINKPMSSSSASR